MKPLYFASQNKNKLMEIKEKLPSSISISDLSSFNLTSDIPETGQTLKENALQKARYISEKYSVDCFADDTGLEVEILNNEPGVYSARYAGEPKNSEKNIDKLLANLKGKQNRNARFKTVIALIIGEEEVFFEGSISGQITEFRKGNDGFGYDSVFIPAGYDKTFAELDLSEKNKISHRAIAVKKLVTFLENRISQRKVHE